MSFAPAPQTGARLQRTRRKLGCGAGIVLCAALIIGNLLYAALENSQLMLDGKADALLYLATFADFTDEWELYAGRQSARIVDGALDLSVSEAATAAWSTARYNYGDFDASVDASAVAGPIDNAFGLVFRFRETGDCDLPALILCGIDRASPLAGAALRRAFKTGGQRDYLAFMISSDGYYALWKTDAGSSRAVSAWIPSPHITPGVGARNRIRVIGRGQRYRFFVNGAPLALCLPFDPAAASTYFGGECVDGEMPEEYVDAETGGGKLGFIAASTATGGGGVVLRFDNLIVRMPGASEVAQL